MDDTANDVERLADALPAVTAWIHSHVSVGAPVLVHWYVRWKCCVLVCSASVAKFFFLLWLSSFQGRSRSQAVVIAYLIRYAKHTFASAFEHVNNVNQNTLAINDGFLRMLQRWESDCKV